MTAEPGAYTAEDPTPAEAREQGAMRYTCRAPGCSRTIGHGLLACSAHWFALPVRLRSDIRDEWDKHGPSARHVTLVNHAVELWEQYAAASANRGKR